LCLLSGFTFACLVLGFFVFDKDEPSTEEDRRVDWIGATLITSGLVLTVFFLSDMPTAREGWRNPRGSSVFLFPHGFPRVLIRRYCWPFLHQPPPRTTILSVAILLGTEAQKPRFPSYALDGAAAHETVDVNLSSRSLRDADYCVCQLGFFLLLVGSGTAVLPDIPQPDTDPHYDPHTAHVLFGHWGKYPCCAGHRTHRRRLRSRCVISLHLAH
jgi:hypothetical protein